MLTPVAARKDDAEIRSLPAAAEEGGSSHHGLRDDISHKGVWSLTGRRIVSNSEVAHILQVLGAGTEWCAPS